MEKNQLLIKNNFIINMCGSFLILGIACIAVVFSLVLHHYHKHQEDLTGCDRCFQTEDVFILCWDPIHKRPIHKRCSHEQFMVLFSTAAVVLIVLFLKCSTEITQQS